jgi:putative peptide zinc metalloprotease protein
VRNLFFQLDWASFEVFKRWHLGSPEAIARDVANHTTLSLGKDDINALLQFAQRNNCSTSAAQRRQAGPAMAVRRSTWMQWLLHNYLFFRLPLVKPDRWLGRWAPRLEFLFSNHFLWLSMLALIAGLWGVSRSWEVHVHPGGLAQPGKDYLPMA